MSSIQKQRYIERVVADLVEQSPKVQLTTLSGHRSLLTNEIDELLKHDLQCLHVYGRWSSLAFFQKVNQDVLARPDAEPS